MNGKKGKKKGGDFKERVTHELTFLDTHHCSNPFIPNASCLHFLPKFSSLSSLFLSYHIAKYDNDNKNDDDNEIMMSQFRSFEEVECENPTSVGEENETPFIRV